MHEWKEDVEMIYFFYNFVLVYGVSPGEFFAEKKNIAGFDNPGKCLYPTVRELDENALDSAKSIELPVIDTTIEEIVKSKFNSMIGHVDRECIDEELYDDHETAKAREERLAKKARAQEMQAKNVALGKKVKEHAVPKSAKDGGESSFYRVTCKDNGRGMPHDDIPNMFERGLNLVQNEYRPADRDLIINEGSKLHFILDINIHRHDLNARNIIHFHEKRDNKDKWHGAEI